MMAEHKGELKGNAGICKECGSKFPKKRYDQVFCSEKCSNRYRQREFMERTTGKKYVKREKIKSVAKWVKFRLEDANRIAKASSKYNCTYSELIRNATIEKLDREGF